jgi:hypothetical protein
MPSAARSDGTADPNPAPPPPTEIAAARERGRKRTPQKTVMGIPRPELPEEFEAPSSREAQSGASEDELPVERFSPPEEPAARGYRARSRVRYDSADEPYPMLQRRKKALRVLGMVIVLAAAWLVYRYLSLHG